MNVENLKKITILAGAIIVACLLVSFFFKILQFVIVAAVVAIVAGIIYGIVAPKIFKDRNKANKF